MVYTFVLISSQNHDDSKVCKGVSIKVWFLLLDVFYTFSDSLLIEFITRSASSSYHFSL